MTNERTKEEEGDYASKPNQTYMYIMPHTQINSLPDGSYFYSTTFTLEGSSVEEMTQDNQKCLIEMQKLSDNFYHGAIKIGNHAFIEFTGLMNEYIKACKLAHDRGEDFTQENIHTGGSVLPDYMKDYFLEKVSCIFGMESEDIYEYLTKKHGKG